MAQAIDRKFLLTTLLSGSVILCADSYAQNGDTYFYPKNKRRQHQTLGARTILHMKESGTKSQKLQAPLGQACGQ